ncbi:hypothetical protein MLD38_004523 [Melastoma candidum]|uniref:Uncharacterized protein n=1 Tax=Melastoma candidum TaxID=119954 RepID=A0ACB9S5Z4_9MYRT|nr:hypothetical protein MLD38_004523 [Melastoma candidum]
MEDLGTSSSSSSSSSSSLGFSDRLIAGTQHRHGRVGLLFDCVEDRGDVDRNQPRMGILEGGLTAFSKPIVVLDFVWNLAFVVVTVVVVFSTLDERPCTPLRLWLCGYGVQCLVHVVFVYGEYRRSHGVANFGFLTIGDHNRMFKRLDSTNTLISSIWWAFGFYWIVIGGQPLLGDSPRLYWLTVIFLAFDVFFVIFCIGLACLVFVALFCCIPLLAIAYAVASVEGATEEMIKSLPKYRYRSLDSEAVDGFMGLQVVRLKSGTGYNSYQGELVLSSEDSECCICLQSYVDGAELSSLPCNHIFHSECVGRWLLINATCPLCKSSILRGDTLV